MHKEAYDCALCSKAYEPTLDEMVEVAFTVNPRVRRIAAHDPHTLPVWEYFRQIFWGTGIDLPETGLEQILEEITIDSLELGPGEKGQISVQLPAEFIIVFEPVTHAAHFIDVKGEPTKERQTLSLIYEQGARADRSPPRCGRARCGSRSTTAAMCARCRRCGSPATRCTTCSASGGRS